MVNFIVEDNDGNRQPVEAPDDMGFSLMEILKASDYPVLATCGGMALCATCHVEILEGKDGLGDATDAELDQLENLPEYFPTSRLACQIRISDVLEGAVIKLRGEDVV
ncbi:ferredoxin, 2Fe-2S [Algoriphagus ornithinivorans]|jgi:2Fe-2S ferredoxin|uniref:Ferredoxin, 2Fe-2S n=2 Tax=Algoriphagus TaxID=246875 RepID=A0A1I5IPR5_9BACT|nr:MULTISPECIES: 2Fe-2S iron-sulfur cluster-binding protein [Algoriphagus]MAL13835.1 ferredoxin [Algoriphagus sp.]MAN87524.1 ferredoxin [Algoriphagus sp.]SFO62206.1 ferredoxin, 2Fe-2S [Algoriphagus ornithinivorans]HAD53128.1 ferredoxin [Algoriphagus sp.]HAH37087.1 ferredoxin [Algoriphagus sp.]|tara:strand:+ start:167 stop:490 length:324 start_codon:yes stop_codon:yes gene_type:complete